MSLYILCKMKKKKNKFIYILSMDYAEELLFYLNKHVLHASRFR